MRAAILTTSFPLLPGSSSGVFVHRLVKALPSSIRAVVLTPDHSAPAHASLEINTVPIRYAPRRLQTLAHGPGGVPAALSRNPWQYLLLPFLLGAAFLACVRMARRVDLIHANWSVNGVIAGLAGLITRRPVVTTLRGTDVAKAEHSALYRLLLRVCVRVSDRVVAVSHALAASTIRLCPGSEKKVVVIPNGVEPQLLDVRRERRGMKLRFVTICTLVRQKGVHVILDALNQMPQNVDWEMVVVGEGPEAANLTSLAKSLNMAHRVHFLGKLKPADIPQVLREADVFVLASFSEGRPNVVLEAMACGVPVIASRLEGISEIVRHGESGLLFEPGHAVELCAQLTLLARDRALGERLGSSARSFIRDRKLLWNETGERYAELYEQTLAEHRAK